MKVGQAWHPRPAVVIAALIFLPPLGIWLAWARSTWSTGVKLLATVLSAALLARGISSSLPHRDRHAPTQASAPVASAPAAPTRAPETPAPATATPVAPVPRPAPAADLPKIQALNKSFGPDRLAGVMGAEYLVTNTGKVPAKLTGCTIEFEDGGDCRRFGEPQFILHAYTREPPGKGKERFFNMEMLRRLQSQRVIPPGGEATMFWKLPMSGLKGCNLTALKAGLDCKAEAAWDAGWRRVEK